MFVFGRCWLCFIGPSPQHFAICSRDQQLCSRSSKKKFCLLHLTMFKLRSRAPASGRPRHCAHHMFCCHCFLFTSDWLSLRPQIRRRRGNVERRGGRRRRRRCGRRRAGTRMQRRRQLLGHGDARAARARPRPGAGDTRGQRPGDTSMHNSLWAVRSLPSLCCCESMPLRTVIRLPANNSPQPSYIAEWKITLSKHGCSCCLVMGSAFAVKAVRLPLSCVTWLP